MTSINRKISSALLIQFIKSNWGIALIITLTWKIVMLGIGYLIDSHADGGVPTLLHHTAMWDAGWYKIVIDDYYQTNAASAAFYPLFPLMVGIIQTASFHFIDTLAAGQIVNTVSVWLAMTALLVLGRNFLTWGKQFWLVILVLSSPAAFFMHVFYGEALFMALGLWAYLFALRRQWLYMGLLLALLTATRLPSILFVGLCGLEFMRSYHWKMRKMFNKNLLYFLLAPIGFIAYGVYLFIERGDFLGMFHAYQATSDWSYQVFDINIVKTILRVAYELFRAFIGQRAFDTDIVVNHLLPIMSLLVLGVCSVYLLLKQKGKFIPLGIFGLVSIIMFTLNSNVVSAHRYILSCLTIYIALSLLVRGTYQNIILVCMCAVGIAVQIVLFSLFISGVFVG